MQGVSRNLTPNCANLMLRLSFASVQVSVFGERDLARLSPPKTSASQLCDSAPCQVPLPAEPISESSTSRPTHHANPLRTTQSDGVADPGSDCFQDIRHPGERSHHLSINERLEKLQTFYSSEKNSISPGTHVEAGAQSSDRENLIAMKRTHTSPSIPLPRLRNFGLKEGRGNKMAWVGLSPPGPPGMLVNRPKPSAFPSHHTLAIKSLRQERSKKKDLTATGAGGRHAGGSNGGKKNSVQLRSSLQRRVGDLNLPLLPATVQEKSEKKIQPHNIDY